MEQAQLQVDELRRELEKGKKVLLDALQAEKENVDTGADAMFDRTVSCGSALTVCFTL